MTFEKATIKDIDVLTNLRLAYLQEDLGNISNEDSTTIQTALPAYYTKHLNRDLMVYVARNQEDIVSCAFLLIVEKPMSPSFITGKTGTVLNVYTKPEYRHNGYATTFTITSSEPCKRWAFDMENSNMKGHWTGLFTEKNGQTEIDFTEDVAPKKWILKPFIKGFLKKQQELCVSDLKKALEQ